jgi:two-component system sensor histidine kinase DesK
MGRRTTPTSSSDSGSALDPAATPGSWVRAPRLARALVLVAFAGLATVPLLRLLDGPDSGVRQALGVGCLLAVLAVQLRFLTGRPAPHRGPAIAAALPARAALLAQAALAYLPVLEFGRSWAGVPGFLAGSCLLALPRITGWIAFTAAVAIAAGVQGAVTDAPFEVAYAVAATVIGGLLVYGLTRLAGLIEELRDARTEVARLAVAGERLRVSRDLHDLIGSSISAITLKSELTARLIRTCPDRACEEIAQVVDISRRALADVRSVARGYREMSLLDETLLARSMLLTADIKARVDVSAIDQLPPDVGTVLGIVIREGVTNVLRHSHATTCDITIRRAGDSVELEIINDGVTGGPSGCPDGGSGLDSLASRVTARSGWLIAEALPGHRWRLFATVSREAQPHRGRPQGAAGPEGFLDAHSA